MKRGGTGGRKIFTIIIGGIIAGILVAIAIPLYTRYVETASVREGLGIIKAIMTSQKVEKSRTGKYYNASTFAEFKSKGIDLSDTKFYTYKTTPTPNGGFIVTAIPTDAFGAGKDPITLRYPTDYTYTDPHPMLYIEPIEP